MRRGDQVLYVGSVEHLRGAAMLVVRCSKRTGILTVEMLADHGAYKKGTHVHVMPYEVVQHKEKQT